MTSPVNPPAGGKGPHFIVYHNYFLTEHGRMGKTLSINDSKIRGNAFFSPFPALPEEENADLPPGLRTASSFGRACVEAAAAGTRSH